MTWKKRFKDFWQACWGRHTRGDLLLQAFSMAERGVRFPYNKIIIQMDEDGYGSILTQNTGVGSKPHCYEITILEYPTKPSSKCVSCGCLCRPDENELSELEEILSSSRLS